MFRRLLALVFALSLVLQHVAAIGLFELGFLSKIPSSCTQQWSKVKYLESGITIGRSCAVYKEQPTIHMQDYLSCTRGDQGCTSRRRNCISGYDEAMSRFVATGTITGSTNIYGYWAPLNVSQTVFDTGAFSSFVAADAASSLVSAASYNPSFVYTPQSPCRGACSLNGGSVQVFVWPTSTVSTNATATAGKKSTNGTLNKNETRPYTLVSGGFTFTSPSIYVAFQSLLASDHGGRVGSSYANSTLSFAPSQLRTGAGITAVDQAIGPYQSYLWTVMQPRDLTVDCGVKSITGIFGDPYRGPGNATDPSVFYATTSGYTGGDGMGVAPPDTPVLLYMTYDPCSPLISVPSEIYKFDPAWSSCTAGISGLWDPPRILQSVSGLFDPVPTPTSQAGTISSSSAAPASTAVPNTPAPTASAGPSSKPNSFPGQPSPVPNPGSNLHPASSPRLGDGSGPNPSQGPGPNLDSGLGPTGANTDNGGSRTLDNSPNSSSNLKPSAGPGAGAPGSGGAGISSQETTGPQSQYRNSPIVFLDLIPSTSPSPIVIGSHTAVILPSGGLSINGATLSASTAPITLDNIPVSVASTYVIVRTSSLTSLNDPPNLSSIGGYHVETAPNDGIVIGGTTLSLGGAGTTIAWTAVSLGPNGLIIGTSTFALPSPVPAPPLPMIGNQLLQLASNGDIILAGTTLSQGSPGTTVAGTVISLGANGLSIGTSTIAIQPLVPAPTLPLIGGQRPQIDPKGNAVFAGTTLSPEQPGIMISGTPVSLGSKGLLIGSSTIAMQPPAPVPTLPLIGGQQPQVYSKGNVVFAATTLTLEQSGITISGTPISLSEGLVIGSSTYATPVPPFALSLPTIGGQQVQQAKNGGIIVASTTLLPGAPGLTISGTSISLGSEGLVIGSSTYAVPSPSPTPILPILGGQQIQEDAKGGIIIAGTTLLPGAAAITISGTPVSLDSAGLVIGSSTYVFLNPTSAAVSTTDANLIASVITSAFATGGATNTPAVGNGSVVTVTVQTTATPGIGSGRVATSTVTATSNGFRDEYNLLLSVIMAFGFGILAFGL